MLLIQELVKRKIIAKDKVAEFEYEIKNSGKTEEEILIEKGMVSEEKLFEIKSDKLKIPFRRVFPDEIGSDLLELIPEDTAGYYKIIPLTKTGNVLEIGMVYPTDLKAQEVLKFLGRQGKFTYEIYLIMLSDFEKVFRRYRSMKKEVTRALEELEVKTKKDELEGEAGDASELAEWRKTAEEAPISKIVAVILRNAVDGNASDIHIEPTPERLRVRFRVLGDLYPSILLPLSYLPAMVARIKILSGLRIDETRMPQDGRFSTKVGDREIDLRVSTLPTILGEKVAIRILNAKLNLKRIEDLGFEKSSLETLKAAVVKSSGMILVTGPTGSGKTTTLYSLLQTFNKDKINIVTLEDPVEYFIDGVNQSQIQPEIDYTFAKGLRYILRQDPNVIMIGEIRDAESAKLAIHAALTGHVMLSTLHTSDVFGVIPRLIDLEVEPYLIPVTLSLAISQRLVRQLCDDCKKKIKAEGRAKDLITAEAEKLPKEIKNELGIQAPFYIYEAVGCRKCNMAGYTDRIGIFEVLKITDSLAKIITVNPSEVAIKEEAMKQGMITMRQSAVIKALKGVTTIEEVIRATEQ